MKSRITEKPAVGSNKIKKKIMRGEREELTLEDLIEIGLVDEETEINIYPKSARNVINHDKE